MSITGVAGGCSRAALTQHFAIRDNLGDISPLLSPLSSLFLPLALPLSCFYYSLIRQQVSAKDGSQETAVSLAGMVLGMLVTALLASEAAGTPSCFLPSPFPTPFPSPFLSPSPSFPHLLTLISRRNFHVGSVFRVHCLPPLLQLQRPACCTTRYVQQVCVRAYVLMTWHCVVMTQCCV